jgi:hypothetical protein
MIVFIDNKTILNVWILIINRVLLFVWFIVFLYSPIARSNTMNRKGDILQSREIYLHIVIAFLWASTLRMAITFSHILIL